MVHSSKNYIPFKLYHFLAGFVSQGVLNKDPAVWLGGARPANTCIPPSFLHNSPNAAVWCTHPQEFICKYFKVKIAEIYMNEI
jgi:hypothetical protein